MPRKKRAHMGANPDSISEEEEQFVLGMLQHLSTSSAFQSASASLPILTELLRETFEELPESSMRSKLIEHVDRHAQFILDGLRAGHGDGASVPSKGKGKKRRTDDSDVDVYYSSALSKDTVNKLILKIVEEPKVLVYLSLQSNLPKQFYLEAQKRIIESMKDSLKGDQGTVPKSAAKITVRFAVKWMFHMKKAAQRACSIVTGAGSNDNERLLFFASTLAEISEYFMHTFEPVFRNPSQGQGHPHPHHHKHHMQVVCSTLFKAVRDLLDMLVFQIQPQLPATSTNSVLASDLGEYVGLLAANALVASSWWTDALTGGGDGDSDVEMSDSDSSSCCSSSESESDSDSSGSESEGEGAMVRKSKPIDVNAIIRHVVHCITPVFVSPDDPAAVQLLARVWLKVQDANAQLKPFLTIALRIARNSLLLTPTPITSPTLYMAHITLLCATKDVDVDTHSGTGIAQLTPHPRIASVVRAKAQSKEDEDEDKYSAQRLSGVLCGDPDLISALNGMSEREWEEAMEAEERYRMAADGGEEGEGEKTFDLPSGIQFTVDRVNADELKAAREKYMVESGESESERQPSDERLDGVVSSIDDMIESMNANAEGDVEEEGEKVEEEEEEEEEQEKSLVFSPPLTRSRKQKK